jgi:hypothetical protein
MILASSIFLDYFDPGLKGLVAVLLKLILNYYIDSQLTPT